ncbi:condensation domain-containing protein [Nostoc carneum NIES-2107]|nr:condensation domain-containing protein [Nostoc carneum NIES-2107]
MNEFFERIAALSPEKCKLLLQKLNNKKETNFSHTQIKPQNRESNRFPLSFAQQRLWYLDQLEPGNPAFNICQSMRLTGLLNVAALEQSFQEVVNRHEILRTTFTVIDGQPLQVINPTVLFKLKLLNLQELSPSKKQTEVLRLANEEAKFTFNLTKDFLLRVTLVQLEETEYALFVTMHHIIADGWSIGVLIREITTLYQAFSDGYSSPLTKLEIQYADFAIWQRSWLEGKELDLQLKYWQQQLDNSITELNLPFDHPRPAIQTYRGEQQFFVLEKTVLDRLKILNIKEGITLFMTILAAFNILLHCYTNREDIVIGTDIANRNQIETKELIGFFVNQLVLRTDLSGNPRFREILQRVKEITLEAYAHQDIPFHKLVEVLNPKRNLSRTPLFNVKLVLENTQSPTLEFSGLVINSIPTNKKTSQFDLLLELSETEQGLCGLWVYSTDLFETATIARMSANFQVLLTKISAHPETHLSELKDILSEVDKQKIQAQTENYESCIKDSLKAIKRRNNDKLTSII